MEGLRAPEVDFESYDHYLDVEAGLYKVVRGLIHERVRSNLRYWSRWPYVISMNLGGIGVVVLLMRVTQGKGADWASATILRVDAVLSEVAAAVLTLGRLHGRAPDASDMCIILDETATREVAHFMRALMLRNIVRVVCPPRDPLAQPSYGIARYYSWPEIFALRLVLATGGHARLGKGSPLFALDDALLRLIALQAHARPPPYFDP
jgi:hypothetical protein